MKKTKQSNSVGQAASEAQEKKEQQLTVTEQVMKLSETEEGRLEMSLFVIFRAWVWGGGEPMSAEALGGMFAEFLMPQYGWPEEVERIMSAREGRLHSMDFYGVVVLVRVKSSDTKSWWGLACCLD